MIPTPGPTRQAVPQPTREVVPRHNSLFKAERIRNPVMRPRGGWKNVGDVEIAVAEYVDWFNHRRLHGEIRLVPPAEFEANHWASQPTEHYRTNPVLTEVGSN